MVCFVESRTHQVTVIGGRVARAYVVGSDNTVPSRFKRSQDHHEAYLRLIRWELDDELAMTEERLRNWSEKKLEANGIALFGLNAKTDGWL